MIVLLRIKKNKLPAHKKCFLGFQPQEKHGNSKKQLGGRKTDFVWAYHQMLKWKYPHVFHDLKASTPDSMTEISWSVPKPATQISSTRETLCETAWGRPVTTQLAVNIFGERRLTSSGSHAAAGSARRITDDTHHSLSGTKTTLILFSYKIFNKYSKIYCQINKILKFITQSQK